MDGVYLRHDDKMTAEQIAQRDASYVVAGILRSMGIDCEVREMFCARNPRVDAAGIFLKLIGRD